MANLVADCSTGSAGCGCCQNEEKIDKKRMISDHPFFMGHTIIVCSMGMVEEA